jgi:hypothetical protein
MTFPHHRYPTHPIDVAHLTVGSRRLPIRRPRGVMADKARYIVDKPEPAPCELSVAVAGHWLGMRLGRKLWQRPADHAAQSSIRWPVSAA